MTIKPRQRLRVHHPPATNVQLHDRFWLKTQNYSLYDILGRDADVAQKFVGGKVY